jgi:MBG domain (YGX type)
LTVTASSTSTTYGSTPTAVTASYSGFVNGDTASNLTAAPTCTTTETASSRVATYPTTCGGAKDPNYTIGYVDGTITVGQAATALTYTGTTSVTTPAAVTPAASLSSGAAACAAGQPVTFTLSSNPMTGAAGTYALETATTSSAGTATGAAIPTSGWLAGAYTVTATFAGTTNCIGSQASAVIAVSIPGTAAAGAGKYSASGAGAVSMGFVVAQAAHGSYTGQLSILNTGRWWFVASVSSYTKSSSTAGTVSGTGTLSWWNPTLNHGHGGWQVAATGVGYTANFTATTKTAVASFGIKIAYTPAAGQPSPLPNSEPVALTSGGILMD